jgi:hypothetical protein
MKYLKYILLLLALVIAFFMGTVYNDVPILKLNPEVRIFEPLSFLLTATIGLLIPFFIKRWIDDSRQVKNNLIEELKETLREVVVIKDKFKFCYQNNAIAQNDKQEIIVMFEQADQRITCLEQQFIESFDQETKLIRAEIRNEYMAYWKLATGAEMMSTTFTVVNENYYRRQSELFTKFETKIKQAINKVHRL